MGLWRFSGRYWLLPARIDRMIKIQSSRGRISCLCEVALIERELGLLLLIWSRLRDIDRAATYALIKMQNCPN